MNNDEGDQTSMYWSAHGSAETGMPCGVELRPRSSSWLPCWDCCGGDERLTCDALRNHVLRVPRRQHSRSHRVRSRIVQFLEEPVFDAATLMRFKPSTFDLL